MSVFYDRFERHAGGEGLKGRSTHYCPGCGKWYWEGSHVARLRAWLERALGRAIAGPSATTPDS